MSLYEVTRFPSGLGVMLTNVPPIPMVFTLRGEITEMVMPLAVMLMCSQCIANAVGSYTGGEIAITTMLLAVMLMYSQCMTNTYGRYWKENYKSNTWHKIQTFNCIINSHIVAIKVSPQTFLSASNVSLAVFA